MKEIEHKGTLYRCPFAHLFRGLNAGEYADLLVSGRAVGFGHPVLTYDSTRHGANCVIDGVNRLEIGTTDAVTLTVLKLFVTDETAERMALDLNIARRQVTADDAKKARAARIARSNELRKEGLPLRTIAAELGVSRQQVFKDLYGDSVNRLTNKCIPENPLKIEKLYESILAETDETQEPVSESGPEPAPDSADELDGFEVGTEDVAGAESDAGESDAERAGNRTLGPVPRHDPRQAYPELLDAITAFATRISKEVNASAQGSKLRTYLLHLGFVFPRAKIVEDKHFGWKCIGLRPLYHMVKLAGLDQRARSKENLLKLVKKIIDSENFK